MPTPDPTTVKSFMDLVYFVGPLGGLLVLLTVCLIALHKYVLREWVTGHVTISENNKLASASSHAAASEHRAGSEATTAGMEINKQMLEVLKDTIESVREKS